MIRSPSRRSKSLSTGEENGRSMESRRDGGGNLKGMQGDMGMRDGGGRGGQESRRTENNLGGIWRIQHHHL